MINLIQTAHKSRRHTTQVRHFIEPTQADCREGKQVCKSKEHNILKVYPGRAEPVNIRRQWIKHKKPLV